MFHDTRVSDSHLPYQNCTGYIVQWGNIVMKSKQAKYLVGRQFGPYLKELSNHFPVKVEKNLYQGYPVT